MFGHQLASPIVAERAERRLLAVGQPLVDGLAGALQGAVDRSDRRLRASATSGREAEHLAQKEDGALRGRVLERRDERELNRLALLGSASGAELPCSVASAGSGKGSSQVDSTSGSPTSPMGSLAGPYSTGSDRAGRRAIASMQTLVAIR